MKNNTLITKSGNYWKVGSNYVDKDLISRSSSYIRPIGSSYSGNYYYCPVAENDRNVDDICFSMPYFKLSNGWEGTPSSYIVAKNKYCLEDVGTTYRIQSGYTSDYYALWQFETGKGSETRHYAGYHGYSIWDLEGKSQYKIRPVSTSGSSMCYFNTSLTSSYRCNYPEARRFGTVSFSCQTTGSDVWYR